METNLPTPKTARVYVNLPEGISVSISINIYLSIHALIYVYIYNVGNPTTNQQKMTGDGLNHP